MENYLTRCYSILLHLYPHQFRSEFGEEMQAVFKEAILMKIGHAAKLFLFFRELLDLPGSLFEAYAAYWLQGGNMSINRDSISPSTRWQAFFGILPFLAFGIVSMMGKVDQIPNIVDISAYLAFYLLVLAGMVVGWIRGFPLWSYSYMGWALLSTLWWWTISITGAYWGFFTLIALVIAVLIGLLLTRSIDPIAKFLSDLSKDWSRLSLAMYPFIAFVYLIYDENHHPNLIFFMTAATLVLTAGAWFFLRSASLWGRVASVWVGFVASHVIGQICDNTWDATAYYGLPEGPPDPWFLTVFRTFMILSILSGILLWPALVDLTQRLLNRRTV